MKSENLFPSMPPHLLKISKVVAWLQLKQEFIYKLYDILHILFVNHFDRSVHIFQWQ